MHHNWSNMHEKWGLEPFWKPSGSYHSNNLVPRRLQNRFLKDFGRIWPQGQTHQKSFKNSIVLLASILRCLFDWFLMDLDSIFEGFFDQNGDQNRKRRFQQNLKTSHAKSILLRVWDLRIWVKFYQKSDEKWGCVLEWNFNRFLMDFIFFAWEIRFNPRPFINSRQRLLGW